MIAHPTWALGFGDEVWWSRLAQPEQHRWVDEEAVTHLLELERSKDDADPKALACYGLLLRGRNAEADQMLLRFVDGRPVSAVTIDFLTVCCEQLAAQKNTALLLIWDNASWHKSQLGRHLDPPPQSDRQADRPGGAHFALLVALQKSLAQPD